MSNDTQVAAHMKLVDDFSVKCLGPVTLENVKAARDSRAAIESSARQLAGQPGFVMVPVELTDDDLYKVAHAAEGFLYEHRVNGPNVRGRAESRAAFVAALAARPLTASPTAQPSVEPVGEREGELLDAFKDAPFVQAQGSFRSRRAPDAAVPMVPSPHETLTLNLYGTTPPPAPVLSDAEIRQWWSSENGLEDMDMCKIDDFTAVVRAIEQAIGRASREASK